jgi:RNA polymerase sigma-70 factor (ECF subfamily)
MPNTTHDADPDPPGRADLAEATARTSVDFDLLRQQLARSVGRVCPPWLADSKEDIVQAALLRVLKVMKSGEQNRTFPASYIWKVAYSATADEIRRVRRRQEVPLGEEIVNEMRPGVRSDPYQDQSLRELGGRIEQCLQRMQERRSLVVGFFLLGHSLAESERLTGWDGKKVRNLLYRGLSDLRSCLASKGLRS